MCGGTPGEEAKESLSLGLSPRVRGNLVAPLLDTFRPGSIPACAGEPIHPGGH